MASRQGDARCPHRGDAQDEPQGSTTAPCRAGRGRLCNVIAHRPVRYELWLAVAGYGPVRGLRRDSFPRERFQRRQQVAHRREAVQRRDGERAQDDRIDRRGHLRDEATKRGGRPHHHFGPERHDVLVDPGVTPGEKLVDEDPPGELIGPSVDRFPAHLFGGHVSRRARTRAHLGEGHEPRPPRFAIAWGVLRRARDGHVDASCDAEVEHLDHAVIPYDDVAGLHVPMDNAASVRCAESACDLDAPVDLLDDGHLVVADERPQRAARYELHRDVRLGRRFADVVDGDDVWMPQRGDRQSFTSQSCARPGAVERRSVGADDLEGHAPSQLGIVGEVHGRHAALTEYGLDGVPVEYVPGGEHRPRQTKPLLPLRSPRARGARRCADDARTADGSKRESLAPFGRPGSRFLTPCFGKRQRV